MATLNVTSLVQSAGTSSVTSTTVSTAASSSSGDKFLNTGKEFIAFQNSSSQGAGATVTVLFAAQNADAFGGAAALHNLSVAIPSSSFGLTFIPPLSPAIFNDANGFVNFTYSAAGLNVGVFSVAPRS